MSNVKLIETSKCSCCVKIHTKITDNENNKENLKSLDDYDIPGVKVTYFDNEVDHEYYEINILN